MAQRHFREYFDNATFRNLDAGRVAFWTQHDTVIDLGTGEVVRASANTRSSHTSVALPLVGLLGSTPQPNVLTYVGYAVFIAFSPLRGWLGQ